MARAKVMGWVERLYEVGDVILKQRDAIEEKMARAAALDEQAKLIRGEAYFDSLRLEARCRELWTDAQIEQAKRI